MVWCILLMEYDVIQRKKKENYYNLFSNSHQAAAEAKELKLKWKNLDINHPWLNIKKKKVKLQFKI